MSDRIWRYLDLPKFIHLIAYSALHFTRVDQFRDKFEGLAFGSSRFGRFQTLEKVCLRFMLVRIRKRIRGNVGEVCKR